MKIYVNDLYIKSCVLEASAITIQHSCNLPRQQEIVRERERERERNEVS